MHFEAVVALFPDIAPQDLSDWIARGWVQPEGTEVAEWAFAEIDIARVGLIRNLRRDLAIEEDAVPVVLSLLDQLRESNRLLHQIVRALEAQPPSVRDAVLGPQGG